ncbi:TPA: hypothetical protein RZK18_001884, partial [Campylobacter coli]|nr:hypothetical protein [Campylobacter coli]
LIGVDWVIDANKTIATNENNIVIDSQGYIIRALEDRVKKGKIKDPRDIDSTPESRDEFDNYLDGYKNGMTEHHYTLEISHDTPEKSANLWLETMLLEAKIKALTPPQGYPNAPRYYSPERLEFIYNKHKLDSKLDPRIPAIYRYNFPRELRAKILAYAKEHNIKD